MSDLFALSDLATPWCVHVVATLKIAQHIESGASDLPSLARAARCDEESLGRVLRHLIAKGLFAEPEPGRFALNDSAKGLLEPWAEFFDLDAFGGRMAHAWCGLLESVRTGRPGYESVWGKPYWEDLDAHPEIAESFDALMGPRGHGTPDPEVLPAKDWESVKTVVDVGGGTGALLAEVLKAHPSVQGVLVDLPRTLARSKPVLDAAGVSARATLRGQSFFDPLPAGADLYMLKSVLCDWPDAETERLLARCAEAARPGGRVVVLNGVSPDDPRGADPNLLMLVLVGGKERTLSQFRALASAAGLRVERAAPTGGWRFVVECRPS